MCKVPRHAVSAITVEAESIDDGAIALEAEQARFGIAGLRPRSDGSDLRKAESHGRPCGDRVALLVEAGRESKGIVEAKAKHLLGEPGVGCNVAAPAECPRDEWLVKRRDRQLVCAFRVESKERGPDRPRIEAHSQGV